MTYFYVISAVLNAKSTAIPPKQQGFVINSVYNMSMSVSALFSVPQQHYPSPSSVSGTTIILYLLSFFIILVSPTCSFLRMLTCSFLYISFFAIVKNVQHHLFSC